MDQNQLLKPVERWQSVVPEEGLPSGMDTWTIDFPVGVLHIGLVDQPGNSTEGEGEMKSYAIGSDLDGLAINSLTLLSKGYRKLNMVLKSKDADRKTVQASLRTIDSAALFNAVFQKSNDEEELLTPSSFWWKESDKPDEQNVGRDLMVMPGEDLKKIQIHFEGGDN